MSKVYWKLILWNQHMINRGLNTQLFYQDSRLGSTPYRKTTGSFFCSHVLRCAQNFIKLVIEVVKFSFKLGLQIAI